MSYGNDSPDAYYSEAIDDNQSQPQEETKFDPSKFVPVEKYNQLEQNFQQIAPKVDYIDKLQQVFQPQQQQFTPEQLAEYQRISQVAQAIVDPELKKYQETQETLVNNIIEEDVKRLGFEDGIEAENWLFETQRRLTLEGNRGNQQASHYANQLASLYNSGNKLALMHFCKNNFQMLDSYAGGLARGKIAPQAIGHSFSNNNFRTGNDAMSLLKEAEQYRHTDPNKHAELLSKAMELAQSQGLV